MSLPETVQSKLDSLPAKPGVYIFKDKKAAILYVGKAKSLRSRVRSYFQEGASDSRQFLPFLQKSVADLETRVTASEKEAAILEASLVKQYQPKFNVKLRDDQELHLAPARARPPRGRGSRSRACSAARAASDASKFRRRRRATLARITPRRRRRRKRSGS